MSGGNAIKPYPLTRHDPMMQQAEALQKMRTQTALDAEAIKQQQLKTATSAPDPDDSYHKRMMQQYEQQGAKLKLEATQNQMNRANTPQAPASPYWNPAIQNMLQAQLQPAPVAPQMPSQVSAPTALPGTAYARAKDVSGRGANAALAALQQQLTSRGFAGGGLERAGTSGILQDAARFNSEAEFEEAQRFDDRRDDFSKLAYQGALSQRNADMGFATNIYNNQLQSHQANNNLAIQALIQAMRSGAM